MTVTNAFVHEIIGGPQRLSAPMGIDRMREYADIMQEKVGSWFQLKLTQLF